MEIEDIPKKYNSKEMTNPNRQLAAEEINAIVDRLLEHGEDIEGLLTAIRANADNIYAHDLELANLDDTKVNLQDSNRFNALNNLAPGIYNNVIYGTPTGTDTTYMLIVGGNGAKLCVGNQTGKLYTLQGNTWVEIKAQEVTPTVKKKGLSKSKIGDVVVHRMIPSVPRKGKKYFFRDGVIKIRLTGKMFKIMGSRAGLEPNTTIAAQTDFQYLAGKKNLPYGGRSKAFAPYSLVTFAGVLIELNKENGVAYIRVDVHKPCMVEILEEGYFAFNKIKLYNVDQLTTQTEDKWLSIHKGRIVCNEPLTFDDLPANGELSELKEIMAKGLKHGRQIMIRKRERVHARMFTPKRKYKFVKLVDRKGVGRKPTKYGRCVLVANVRHKGHESIITKNYDYMLKYE